MDLQKEIHLKKIFFKKNVILDVLFQLTNFRFFLFFKNFDSPHIHSSSVLQIAVPTRKDEAGEDCQLPVFTSSQNNLYKPCIDNNIHSFQ